MGVSSSNESDFTAEARALLAETRALLEWDQGMGAEGYPSGPPAGGDDLPVAPPPGYAVVKGPSSPGLPDFASALDVPDPSSEPSPSGSPTVAIPSGAEGAARPAVASRDAFEVPPADPEARLLRLQTLESEVRGCTRCGLSEGRTQTVFARGSHDAEIVFVGEAPGFHEDEQGVPFVGPAGQLLDKMIGAMGYKPEQVYICNVLKCRPPENRTPLPNEAAACEPYLAEQLALVQPKVIVALGKCAAENLGCIPEGARGWRGVWRSYRNIPVMPTYHPAFLLRSPEMKRPVWHDLQAVMKRLGRA